MQRLTIGQVARQAGVRTSAIRYYESIALLPPPERSGGQRRYEPTVLDRLAFIGAARKLGFSLTEIHTLLTPGAADVPLAARWQKLANHKVREIDRVIAQATLIRFSLLGGLECGCRDLASCLGCIVAHSPREGATPEAGHWGNRVLE